MLTQVQPLGSYNKRYSIEWKNIYLDSTDTLSIEEALHIQRYKYVESKKDGKCIYYAITKS